MGIRKLDVTDAMLVQPHFCFSIRKLVIALKPQLVNLRTELLTARSDRYLKYPIIRSDQPMRIPLAAATHSRSLALDSISRLIT